MKSVKVLGVGKMNELFENVTSVDEFQDVVVENKKSFWGERIGNSSFGGAGQKAILLNTPNGKEFVSYENAFEGNGKYGKLLKSYFFGASEVDNMSVTDILNIIDENLSDSDILLLIESLTVDSPLKISVGDVLGGATHKAINIQKYFDMVSEDFSEKMAKALNKKRATSVLMGVAICDYFNDVYDFMDDGFNIKTDNVHVVWMSKSDMGALRRYASDNYILFTSHGVDALAKRVESDGVGKLKIRLLE